MLKSDVRIAIYFLIDKVYIKIFYLKIPTTTS